LIRKPGPTSDRAADRRPEKWNARIPSVASSLVTQGWTDALRALHPDERIYTFWKYFRNAFARDAGLRIDHLLLSPSLAGRLAALRRREVRQDDRPPLDLVGRPRLLISGSISRAGARTR
jgi:exonuclease III